MATFKRIAVGTMIAAAIAASLAVIFAAVLVIGASGQQRSTQTLGESCKDLHLIAKGSPEALTMYVKSEAAALKMDVSFYLKWCKRLDK